VLGGGDALDAELIAQIEGRAPGRSVLDAVRAHTLQIAERMRDTPAERRDAFRAVVSSAPSVQARWRERQRHHEGRLAELLAAETAAASDDAAPFVVAGVLGLLGRLAFYDVIGWPDGKRRSKAKTELAIARVFDLLAACLHDYGKRSKAR
jgi:hypothetical protein